VGVLVAVDPFVGSLSPTFSRMAGEANLFISYRAQLPFGTGRLRRE